MFRAPLKILTHLAGALLLLLVIACAFEIYLRVQDARHPPATAPLLDVSADLQPVMAPSWYAWHQLKPLAKTLYHPPNSSRTVSLTTNSWGLRGPEIPSPKPPGSYRILCLGDEHTLAPHLSESRTFVARLASLLQQKSSAQIEVLNAGLPSGSPLTALLLYRHHLAQLQPDLVIYNFDLSDVADQNRIRRHVRLDADGLPLALPHIDLVSKSLSPIENWEHQFATLRLLRKSLFRNWLGKPAVPDPGPESSGPPWWHSDSPENLPPCQRTMQSLAWLADECRKNETNFLLAFLPHPDLIETQLGSPKSRSSDSLPPAVSLLADTAEKHNFPFCNPLSDFLHQSDLDSLFEPDQPTLSDPGHALYAQSLARSIIASMGSARPVPDTPDHPSSPAAGPTVDARRSRPAPLSQSSPPDRR